MTRPILWTGARPLRRWRIFLGVLLVIAAVASAVYGLLGLHLGHPDPGGGAASAPAPSDAAVPARPAPAHSALARPPAAGDLPPVAATPDPEAFATDVAHALFDWDTTAGFTLADYRGRLLAVADPSGLESPGLVADLTGYLPSPEAWDFLAGYETCQRIHVASVAVPAQWHDARAVAPEDTLAAGATALTVTGTRERTGTWEGGPVAERFDLAFTLFAVCEPTYSRCYLLRLSRLDEQLT